jgi:hypothetical protein
MRAWYSWEFASVVDAEAAEGSAWLLVLMFEEDFLDDDDDEGTTTCFLGG